MLTSHTDEVALTQPYHVWPVSLVHHWLLEQCHVSLTKNKNVEQLLIAHQPSAGLIAQPLHGCFYLQPARSSLTWASKNEQCSAERRQKVGGRRRAAVSKLPRGL